MTAPWITWRMVRERRRQGDVLLPIVVIEGLHGVRPTTPVWHMSGRYSCVETIMVSRKAVRPNKCVVRVVIAGQMTGPFRCSSINVRGTDFSFDCHMAVSRRHAA